MPTSDDGWKSHLDLRSAGKSVRHRFLMAWCPACKEESPHITLLTAEYEANGMTDYFGNELLDDNEMRLDRLLAWQM